MSARLHKGYLQNVRPRDAATLLIYDRSGGEVRLLMGQRHLTHKFMPGKFVFPGGRVEPIDYRGVVGARLPEAIVAKLLRSISGVRHGSRALAMAHAAIRETGEETGVIVGANDPREAGDSAGVADFGALSLVARAVTPPRRPRRFDTRFFAAPAEAITSHLGSADGEFIASHWLTLEEARAQDIPTITRAVLDDVAGRLGAGTIGDPQAPVPFYFMRGACFHRRLL